MANLAMQYGGNFADQGKEYMQKNVCWYMSIAGRVRTIDVP